MGNAATDAWLHLLPPAHCLTPNLPAPLCNSDFCCPDGEAWEPCFIHWSFQREHQLGYQDLLSCSLSQENQKHL